MDQIDDLYSAEPGDQFYTLDPESGYVKCGDGLRGMRFPLGSVLRSNYEYGVAGKDWLQQVH